MKGGRGEKKDLLKSTNYKNRSTKGEEARKDIEGEVTGKSYRILVIQREKRIFVKVRSHF